MAEIACAGPCNHHWREAQTAFRQALAAYDPLNPDERRPVPPQVFPVPGEPVWCGRCAAAIRAELAELDDLACLLAAAADGHRGAGAGERVTGTAGRRSPSPSADVLDELYSVLHGWESAYRGTDPVARRGYLASALTTCVAWMVAHFDGMIRHPDIGVPFGEEVRQWHRSLRRRAKAGSGRRRKPLPCPRCDEPGLIWNEGDTYVRCGNRDCGRLLSLDEYDEYEKLAAGASAA